MHVIEIDAKQFFGLIIYEIRLNFDTPLALKWLLMATFKLKMAFESYQHVRYITYDNVYQFAS